MKLSEAIRLGAMMKPQHYGEGYSPDGSGSCAMFAAIDAFGGFCSVVKAGEVIQVDARGPVETAIADMPCFTVPDEWQRITHEVQVCPHCGDRELGIFVISEHLNDDHYWTREQIADWVEQIESQQLEEVRHDVSEVSA